MPPDPLMSYRRLMKKPPSWRQVVVFAIIFTAVCATAWGLQQLGYWPQGWTVNPGEPVP